MEVAAAGVAQLTAKALAPSRRPSRTAAHAAPTRRRPGLLQPRTALVKALGYLPRVRLGHNVVPWRASAHRCTSMHSQDSGARRPHHSVAHASGQLRATTMALLECPAWIKHALGPRATLRKLSEGRSTPRCMHNVEYPYKCRVRAGGALGWAHGGTVAHFARQRGLARGRSNAGGRNLSPPAV